MPVGARPIAAPGTNVVVLIGRAYQFHADAPPAVIGIRLRVIGKRVEMGKVIADGSEGFLLVLPVFGKVGFAAGAGAHAPEDGAWKQDRGAPVAC